jgi:hypothetical protein
MTIEDMAAYGSDWSNNKQLLWNNEGAKDITLTIRGLDEQTYDMTFYFTKGPDYSSFTLTAGDAQLAIKGFAEIVAPIPGTSISNVRVMDGIIEFVIKKQTSDMKPKVGLDAIMLTPVRKYIPEWYMIGPFDNPRNSDAERFGIDKIYPPEQNIDLDATYSGKNDQITWQEVDGTPGGYGMGLWSMFEPSEFIISYALTYIYSPDDREAILKYSSDDGSKIFLNDEEIYRFLAVNIARPDQTEVKLKLKKGQNKLLLKLENNFGGYAFYARITDPDLVISRNFKSSK